MPRYLMSVYGPAERNQFGDYPSKEDMLQSFADTGVFNDMLVEKGYFVFADGLEPVATATTVDGQGATRCCRTVPTSRPRSTSAASG